MKKIFFILGIYLGLASSRLISPQQEKEFRIQRSSPYLITLTLANHIASPFKKDHAPYAASNAEKILGALLAQSIRPFPSGLYATYYGFSSYLNANSQIIFPRKNATDTVLIIVTKQIYPIITRGRTVNYFVRRPDLDAAFYEFKRIKDSKTETYCWETKEIQAPKNSKIPVDAIILHAKPNELYIPEGLSKTIGGEHLILPIIYPTKELARSYGSLSFLKIKKYFAPIEARTEIKRSGDRYSTLIRP
ncbi:TPA: hypothetical protein DCW54_00265 [Candidatus Dependentiae bacterium]|nr:hypothetical protein [Candidatus Dependentiae bacterium]